MISSFDFSSVVFFLYPKNIGSWLAKKDMIFFRKNEINFSNEVLSPGNHIVQICSDIYLYLYQVKI